MKRVLLIGFILAICILAMPQGVLAIDRPVTVNAVYTTATTFTVTGAITSGVYDMGILTVSNNEKTDALLFTVNSLTDWTVTGLDTTVPTIKRGYMQGSYTDPAKSLQNSFEVTIPAGGWWNFVSTTPLAINSGGPKSSDQTWLSSIRQIVTTTDYGSSSGYHIQTTYTCTAGF
jgi:hypothetical protein